MPSEGAWVESKPATPASKPAAGPAWSWCLVALGYVSMYGPTVFDLSQGVWTRDEQGHGPIILAIAAWLFYSGRETLTRLPSQPRPLAGWSLLILGLLAFVIGRSQAILLLELGSQIPVISGVLLLMKGWASLRSFAFPVFFLLFMIPLPGPLVIAVTAPLKLLVSYLVVNLLGALDYPISRTGVLIAIGPYQLLVADACAGLSTMFTLESMGLLYLHMTAYRSMARKVVLALLVIPISIFANMVRVAALVLITYHLGDAAGQGFLHGFAGMVLFLVGLMAILLVDKQVLSRCFDNRSAP